MPTTKQHEAAKENIVKAQRRWQEMSHRERASAQPEGKNRAKPGSKGEGDYFRIVVRPKADFDMFRYHDVGEKGHILRLAGKRSNGSWDTQTWLISKDDAHIEGHILVADTEDAKELIDSLETKPLYVMGDIFVANDRYDFPESEQPTKAQQRAMLEKS